jgi:hypothetical protein
MHHSGTVDKETRPYAYMSFGECDAASSPTLQCSTPSANLPPFSSRARSAASAMAHHTGPAEPTLG